MVHQCARIWLSTHFIVHVVSSWTIFKVRLFLFFSYWTDFVCNIQIFAYVIQISFLLFHNHYSLCSSSLFIFYSQELNIDPFLCTHSPLPAPNPNPLRGHEMQLRHFLEDDQVVARTRDCDRYFDHHVNAVANAGPITRDENAMPLAYGIMLHKQVSDCSRRNSAFN